MAFAISIMALYFLILTGLGIYKASKIKNQTDFSVAGRSLSPWVLVGTMLATWVGTGSILGNAGKAYETGLAALILPIGSVCGIILLTQIAGKVRSYEKFTVPEILADRYGETARLLGVFALVCAYMVIVSYQYNAGGAVLHTILKGSSFEMSMSLAIKIAATFIVIYTMLAGLVSVAYTDVGNGIIMTISLMIAFPVLWFMAGGASGMETAFASMNKTNHMKFWGVYSNIELVNFLLPPFLLILGDANMYQRFFASKDAKGAKKATIVLIFVVAVVEILIIACAWVASSLVTEETKGKYILITIAHSFLEHGHLATLLGALMLTTIIGIIVSTADSYLLVPATTIMRDVYQTHVNKDANEKKIVLLSRLLIVALGLIAYWVSTAFAQSETFFTKALYAYTIYGAAITPVLVAALFWKKASSKGAIASIIAGISVTILWSELTNIFYVMGKEEAFLQSSFYNEIYKPTDAVLPAIFASVACLIIFSLFFPDKAKKTSAEESQ
ncbi:sodium:solute symporter [Candidatus Uabimicrobium sp. HlEnr_7]|uniref:sodium:solute symporter family protein n=1 Tax=Candidatus Uabimicrobium helgolandensis TaxID=3095367 RepID=UPI0035570005